MSTPVYSLSISDNTRVSDPSPPYDCQEIPTSLTNQLEFIFQKRDSVGLMILTVEGEVLCFNASARDIILTNGNVDKHFADIRSQLVLTDKRRLSRDNGCSGSSQPPILQLLVSRGTNWYGLRGFWLETAAESPSSLVGVVIEQINLRRLDLKRAQRLYSLSPQENAVVTALAAGKTDKQIALTLDVSPETVRWYLKNIRTKMAVSTRTGILHKVFLM